PEPPSVTDSSALIDLRALCTSSADVSVSHGEEIASLRAGGAFAPLLAPPIVPSTVPEDEEGDRPPAARRTSLALAVSIVAILGPAVFAATRSAERKGGSATTERLPAADTSTGADRPTEPAPIPSAASAPEPAPPRSVRIPVGSTVIATKPPSPMVTVPRPAA